MTTEHTCIVLYCIDNVPTVMRGMYCTVQYHSTVLYSNLEQVLEAGFLYLRPADCCSISLSPELIAD